MIVLDASAAVEFLLGLPRADAVAERLSGARARHAPHLLGIEVAQVVRRFTRHGAITAERGAAALADCAALPLARHPHEPLLGEVWRMRATVSAYDAVYVALAEALGAALVTLDARLAAAAGDVIAVDLVR